MLQSKRKQKTAPLNKEKQMEKILSQDEEVQRIAKLFRDAISEIALMSNKYPKKVVTEFTALFFVACGFNKQEMLQIISGNDFLTWLFTDEDKLH